MPSAGSYSEGMSEGMSEAMLDFLQESLNEGALAHPDHGAGMVQEFLCIVTFVDQDGELGWAMVNSPNSRLISMLGLARFLMRGLDADASEAWQDEDY